MFGESKIIIISPLSPRLIVTDKAIDGSERGTGAVHILILEKLIQSETLLYLRLSLKTDEAVLLRILEQTNRGLVLFQVTARYSTAFLSPNLLECVPSQRFCWRHV